MYVLSTTKFKRKMNASIFLFCCIYLCGNNLSLNYTLEAICFAIPLVAILNPGIFSSIILMYLIAFIWKGKNKLKLDKQKETFSIPQLSVVNSIL